MPGLDLLDGIAELPAPNYVSPEAIDTWGSNAVARAWNQLAVFTAVTGYSAVLTADLPTIVAVAGPSMSDQGVARLTSDFPGYRAFSATIRDRNRGPIPDSDRNTVEFQSWLNFSGLLAAPNWRDLAAVTDILFAAPTITTWQDGSDGGLVIRFSVQATANYGPDTKPTLLPVARDTTVYLVPNPDRDTQENTPWLIHDWVATYNPGTYPWIDGHNWSL